MKTTAKTAFLLLLLIAAVSMTAQQQPESMLKISGVTYTKWLWGNLHDRGSLYNFTTVPGEGAGDNGQGTEIELLLSAKPNKYLEVSGRIHSRFSQNFWTNFGGFGGRNPATEEPPRGDCIGGDCGEFDPRSNQYVKLRGMTVRITPGYKYLDAVTFGATDLGQFDAFTLGKIRYIDRDNLGALMAQGSLSPNFRYDLIRVSMPRLWAGYKYSTGAYANQDAAYAMQFRWTATPQLDITGIAEKVSDIEVDNRDFIIDDGRDVRGRYSNDVYGIKADYHPDGPFAVRAALYHASSDPNLAVIGESDIGFTGYSPVPLVQADDNAYKLNVDITDPFKNGLSLNLEYFNIGADYVSVLAARRESDVLLTEGHDGTWALNGPSNAKYGVFGGNPTLIGYSGWQGNAQQVVSLAVDNEFTDFDEPMAETVVGWKGFTLVPRWQRDTLEIAGELTHIDYNNNWQAWGDPSRDFTKPLYPTNDLYTGVFNFRSPYNPFQDKTTDIALIRGRYTIDVAKGVDVFGKIKTIQEEDKRINDARYLPYQAGSCPGGGVACADNRNFYSPGLSTGNYFSNPPVITVNGVTGYKWAPFDSLDDDDRDMDYTMFQLGAGYQLTDIIYGSLTFERYDVDLKDGNTAFQAYNLHEMGSGQHEKNKWIVGLRFPIGGAEAGFNYEYTFGQFQPEFGGGFVPQVVDESTAKAVGVPLGSLGFSGRYGNWNSLETRDFDHQHLKAYFKVRF